MTAGTTLPQAQDAKYPYTTKNSYSEEKQPQRAVIPKLNFSNQPQKSNFNQTSLVRGGEIVQQKKQQASLQQASARKKFVIKKMNNN